MMKRLVLFSMAAALTATALASCTDDDAADPPPPTTTSPTQADEEALEQLANDWYETNKAIFRSGLDAGASAEFIGGEYLSGFQDQVEEFRTTGNRVRANEKSSHDIESISIDGSDATVVECIVDADQLIDGTSGDVLNEEVNALRYSTKAVRTDGRWRFTSRSIEQEWKGATTCVE